VNRITDKSDEKVRDCKQTGRLSDDKPTIAKRDKKQPPVTSKS